MSSHGVKHPSRLATDPSYLAHAIASLRVATGAEPSEYMDTAPYPGPEHPMSDEAAAWVREFVWTKKMRKTHSEVPAAAHTCACQGGPSGHCNADRHGMCWHTANEPFASPETYVCGPDGITVLAFTERFQYLTGGATGPKRDATAMVWLADRACRWHCPCDCHTSSAPAPELSPAEPEPRIDKPVQLDLFDTLTA